MTRPPVRAEDYIMAGHRRIVFGLGVLFVGTLIHTIGTITRGWSAQQDGDHSYGLFNRDYNVNGSLIAVRAFTILGSILGVVALVLTGVYLKLTGFLSRRKVATCILVVGIGAGGSSLIGALIYALEFYLFLTVTDKNYSFILCIVGGVFMVFGSILVFLGARQHLRGSISRGRIIIRSQMASGSSTGHIPYQGDGHSDVPVWHTQVYTEPPPAYNQLEHSLPPTPKEQPSEVFDALPPSYSEAVKWYPKT